MEESDSTGGPIILEPKADPRTLLGDWANKGDEWTRRVVQLVISSGRPLSEADIDLTYDLFLQEKLVEERKLPLEALLSVEVDPAEREAPLELTTISNVQGVNAIKTGSTIDLNPGLTILYGENGTGKTGYARILKALANSRTADEVLPDIHDSNAVSPGATIIYRLGDDEHHHVWSGDRGQAPFTRMSVFDAPAVFFHVDEDLAYVYTPASLALFNHVTQGIQGVQGRLDGEIKDLNRLPTNLLGRFERGSTVYPQIEGLGAATDLAGLEALSKIGPGSEETIRNLELAVAALQVNALPQQITNHQRIRRVFAECDVFLNRLKEFDYSAYNSSLTALIALRQQYRVFREELFAAADLPAVPEASWEDFVRAGQVYQEHLEAEGVNDEERCLYCRQGLSPEATGLVAKYRDYLDDRIVADIHEQEIQLEGASQPLLRAGFAETGPFLSENPPVGGEDSYVGRIRKVHEAAIALQGHLRSGAPIIVGDVKTTLCHTSSLAMVAEKLGKELAEMQAQSANRDQALNDKQTELRELKARYELNRSWPEVVGQVQRAQRASKLSTFGKKIPTLLRQVTELSKTASDQLINQNFGSLFEEECKALRTPDLKLEFVGRQGRAQRRKVLTGNYKPSKILSEGEQKVLALADFLAEARLTGITAPIIFDDPVCSLDHRRIQEVAERITLLASTNQVVVFTHDILFATSLLSRFERSSRCTYYSVTDEDGKGNVAHATGPRWDTLKNLRKSVNESIQAAKESSGEVRAAFVRTGYDWIRSWCEVFVETELLAEVTQRYQPNVRMGALKKIKPDALPKAIDTISKLFEDACRYIDGHSQPLAALGVSPTLLGLETDWALALACQKEYSLS